MLKIFTVPHPLLRQKSLAVVTIDAKIQKFIRQLEQTLIHADNPKGVGLSAPQVGKLWRIFYTTRVFINPQIVSASKKLILGPDPNQPILEGCLSIPHIWGPVYRHQWIKLRWQMANGRWQTAKFSDFPARVIQHEIDHLNGILFTDHSLKQHQPLYQEKRGKLTPLDIL